VSLLLRRWLNQWELKARRHAIQNVMYYVVMGMAVVFALDFFGLRVSGYLLLSRHLVAQGQIWRLISFIFMPPSNSLIWVFFSLYFYWMIGTTLENQWGSFRFDIFYGVGILSAWLAALCTGSATNVYLNLSLFFAFAAMYPDFQVMLFFILPVKMKWLALLNLVIYVYTFIVGDISIRISILFSLVNVILFFGGDFLTMARTEIAILRRRYNFRKNYRSGRR